METELYHYGVKGMKWGVRRARRKRAKQAYRSAKNNAFERYESEMRDIEKSYKRGQNLSDRDIRREAAAEKRYSDAIAKAKSDYKAARGVGANRDYSAKQRKQDRAFYGKGGERRINKKLNDGYGLRGARHHEAERKAKKEKAAKAAKKGAKKTAAALSTIGTYYIIDQVFYGGKGTKMVKDVAVGVGRATVTGIMMAMGRHDIKWYDKQGRRVG